jgi:3-(3-hydroxy-phenyl)propionate hydroxylase
MTEQGRIVIAGAGPVGAVTALAAARRGYAVTLLEAAAEIDTSPRAATFHPSTIEMLASLGIVKPFIAAGLTARYFDFWDKPALSLTARMDHENLRDDTDYPFVVQTEQHKLVRIILDELARYPDVDIRMGWQVDGVEQDDSSVTVSCVGPDSTDKVHGRWLVGADGGRSFVRKSQGIEFEGFTWAERFLVLTSLHDFDASLGCSYRSYFADPGGWANLFKVAGDDFQGRWRAVFAAEAGESDEEALGDASAERRLKPLTDGAPLQIVHRNLYKVHQRVAKSFRYGRIFLAGDAAHVNNPIGGLGLNCGIHDATELINTLHGVDTGAAPPERLDRYERRRRTLNIEFVQQQTVDNKKRLEEKDPALRRKRLQELEQIAEDPRTQREFLLRTSLLASVARSQSIQ